MDLHPNARQVAGNHYEAEYQHWDFVIQWNVPYLPAQVTKYLTRHKRKNGREDLEKAIHYAEKMLDLRLSGWKRFVHAARNWHIAGVPDLGDVRMTATMYEDFRRFVRANDLDAAQQGLMWLACTNGDPAQLLNGLRSYMEVSYYRHTANVRARADLGADATAQGYVNQDGPSLRNMETATEYAERKSREARAIVDGNYCAKLAGPCPDGCATVQLTGCGGGTAGDCWRVRPPIIDTKER